MNAAGEPAGNLGGGFIQQPEIASWVNEAIIEINRTIHFLTFDDVRVCAGSPTHRMPIPIHPLANDPQAVINAMYANLPMSYRSREDVYSRNPRYKQQVSTRPTWLYEEGGLHYLYPMLPTTLNATPVALSSGGSLVAGKWYAYVWTYFNATTGTETLGAESSPYIQATAGNGTVTVTTLDSPNAAPAGTTAKRVYRQTNGGDLILQASISPTDPSYLDTGTADPAPNVRVILTTGTGLLTRVFVGKPVPLADPSDASPFSEVFDRDIIVYGKWRAKEKRGYADWPQAKAEWEALLAKHRNDYRKVGEERVITRKRRRFYVDESWNPAWGTGVTYQP